MAWTPLRPKTSVFGKMPVELIENFEPFLNVAPAGTHQKPGFRVELRQRFRGEFLEQFVHADAPMGRQRLQPVVLILRQSYGQCTHNVFHPFINSAAFLARRSL